MNQMILTVKNSCMIYLQLKPHGILLISLLPLMAPCGLEKIYTPDALNYHLKVPVNSYYHHPKLHKQQEGMQFHILEQQNVSQEIKLNIITGIHHEV